MARYGCGVLGLFGGEQFAVVCAQIIPLLVQVVNDPNSRVPENVNLSLNFVYFSVFFRQLVDKFFKFFSGNYMYICL